MFSSRFVQISSNVLWLALNRLVRLAVGVVVLGLVGRYLEPDQFGNLNYAISLAAIFGTIATLGFEGLVIAELVKNPDETPTILGTAFLLRSLGALMALAVAVASSCLLKDTGIVRCLVLVIVTSFFPQSFDVIEMWFQKNIQAKYTVIARLGAVVLGAALRITLVLVRAPLIWFAWAIVIEAVFSSMALVVVFGARGENVLRWRLSWPIGLRLLRLSWPLIFSGLLVAIYFRIEQILVMTFLGSHSMGIYYAATRITEMWVFLPGLILSTIYPLLVEKRERDIAGYKIKLQTIFDLLTGCGYLIALTVTLFAPLVIPMIYGEKYREAIPILLIQSWTVPVVFSGSVRAQYLLLENRTVYHLGAALIGIAVNVTVALWLMPKFGPAGAAFGALAGSWLSGYLTSVLFFGLRECGWFQTKAFLLPFRCRELLQSIGNLR